MAYSFILEVLFWGLPYSYGVLQQYYLSTSPFSSASEQTTNAIGTVRTAPTSRSSHLNHVACRSPLRSYTCNWSFPFLLWWRYIKGNRKLSEPFPGPRYAFVYLVLFWLASQILWAFLLLVDSKGTEAIVIKPWQLVLLQGVVFGSSAGLVWSPILIYVSELRCLSLSISTHNLLKQAIAMVCKKKSLGNSDNLQRIRRWFEI